MRTVNIINVSGGKDSTAVLLLALEQQVPNMRLVFADTGHEHPLTYAYIDQLERDLGVTIERVKGDFTRQIARRRQIVTDTWEEPARARALEVLHPTGIPFLDLCLWKGLFPSNVQRFCTDFLKVKPIQQVQEQELERSDKVVTWLGIRADESAARADALEWEREFGPADNPEAGFWKYRPIVTWTAAQVFDYIASKGLKPNPLYTMGMSRVGCLPCIMARKGEIAEIAKRFPEEIDRIARWEVLVNQAHTRESACSLIPAKTSRTSKGSDITLETHGIRAAAAWAQTSYGGRQTQFDFGNGGGCSSVYGLCETDTP